MSQKLSERESRIISAMMHRGNATASEIAKLSGYPEHSVRYVMGSLKNRNIWRGRAPFINTYPLGFTGYTMFCSFARVTETQESRIIENLKQSPGVSWIAKIGGGYEYAIAFIARRIESVTETFYQLSEDFGDVFAEKTILITTRFHAFVRKHLAPELTDAPVMYFGTTDTDVLIDELDHAILARMSAGNYQSHREVARDLDIHHTRLERRLQRMEESRVISGYINMFNPEILGMQSYRLLINANGINRGLSKKLYDFAAKHPNILRYMETVGAWDYEMELEVSEAEDVTKIIQNLRSKFFENIRTIRSIQIFRHLKYSAYPIKL